MAEKADQAITALPKKTSSGIAATDYLLGIDSAEGYQMLIQDLGNYIIQNVTSSLNGSNQTLAAALSALNSNLTTLPLPMISGLNTQEKIDAAYNDAHDNVVDNVHYIRLIVHGMSHNVLGGGRFLLEGYRATRTYGWQKITAYSSSYGGENRKFERANVNGAWTEWKASPKRAEVDALNTYYAAMQATAHPAITDVLTPASDVTITSSYVSVKNGMVILDCNFTQTSTNQTDRFTFKTGYKPATHSSNIAPVFMYSNGAVSNSVLFVNPSTLTIFGANPVSNQAYYFRLIYFIAES